MKHVMIFLIKIYKAVSRLFNRPSCCRFNPTCSTYTLLAYEKYGFFKGTTLGLKRILRCHPLNRGGYDPLQ